jgi:hypothetical protein
VTTREDVDLAVRFLEATKDDERIDSLKLQRQVAGAILWLYGMDKLAAYQATQSAQNIAFGTQPPE